MKPLYLFVSGTLFGSTLAAPALAQITVDGTTNTNLTPIDNGVQIDDGDRAGGNLFHSFREFSVSTGSEAFFNNAGDIVNIFSRVTGGNISNIDGLLRANGAANLFMINPAGIIFGENASLNIGGSFYGSSADSIIFPDGEFSATDLDNPPLITINAPLGLGIRDNPGDIVNQSTADGFGLSVNEGENISLIGGNVRIANGGIIFAPGGRVELGGLIEAGTVNFNEDGSLTFPENIARGDVSVNDFSNVSVFSVVGGSIVVNARNFNLTSGSSLNVGILPGNGNIDSQTGDLAINAIGNVSLDSATIFNQIGTGAIGNTGDIVITGQNIFLTNDGLIFNTISGQGNTGDIIFNATDSITFDGSALTGILSFVAAEGQGNLGRIQLTADNISFTNGGGINSLVSGLGNSGDIEITTNNLVLDGEDPNNDLIPSAISSQNSGIGDAGSIDIITNNLTVTNGSQIGANISSGQGNAGDINLAASQITIRGQSSRSGLASSISSNIQGDSQGNGGNINITTDSLSLEEGGQISASTIAEGNAGTININATSNVSVDGGNGTLDSTITATVLSDTLGQGGSITINTPNIFITNNGDINTFSAGQEAAGDIAISTNNFLIDDGTINSTNSGQGDAGDISIAVSDQFTATNGSLILTNVGNTIGAPTVGRVGNITITARKISLENSSQIQAGVFSGATAEGTGAVSLTATESISFTGINTGIFSSNDPGSFGNASVAQLSAPIITIKDGAVITSENLGQGDASSISITTDNFLIDDGTITSTNAGQGNAGSISIAVSDKFTASNSIISTNIGNRAGATTLGRVGNIEITAREISLDNAAQIQAGAFSGATAEEAGIVSLTATESISLTGNRTGIFTNNDPGSFGNASNVQLSAPTISLNDSAGITASNDANGQGGNVTVETEQLNLTNDARILANAAGSGNGGNITLNVTEDIALRNNSFISARAFEDANGGNLNINARFILAFPSQGNGNDLIATAERGIGGNIKINARQIFNLQEGNAIDENGNFFPNNSNDIDVSSQAEGLDGTVAINTPDVAIRSLPFP